MSEQSQEDPGSGPRCPMCEEPLTAEQVRDGEKYCSESCRIADPDGTFILGDEDEEEEMDEFLTDEEEAQFYAREQLREEEEDDEE